LNLFCLPVLELLCYKANVVGPRCLNFNINFKHVNN